MPRPARRAPWPGRAAAPPRRSSGPGNRAASASALGPWGPTPPAPRGAGPPATRRGAGIQPFPAQQRGHVTRLTTPVGLLQDAALVLGGEPPARGLRHDLDLRSAHGGCVRSSSSYRPGSPSTLNSGCVGVSFILAERAGPARAWYERMRQSSRRSTIEVRRV